MCREKISAVFTYFNWEGILVKLKGKVYTNCERRCLIYGSETWQINVEHETKLNRNEISMLRQMCGFWVLAEKTYSPTKPNNKGSFVSVQI